jgi:sulfoxide reductase catalytic subunit YedY
MPKVRFDRLWISVLWALPIAFLVLLLGVAVAQGLLHLPEVQSLFPVGRAVVIGSQFRL